MEQVFNPNPKQTRLRKAIELSFELLQQFSEEELEERLEKIGIQDFEVFRGRTLKEVNYYYHAYLFRKQQYKDTKKGWLTKGIAEKRLDEGFFAYLLKTKSERMKKNVLSFHKPKEPEPELTAEQIHAMIQKAKGGTP